MIATQCATCPWRVDCEPERDIPNGYSRELHEELRDTIAEPGSFCQPTRIMACHYSPVGTEKPCVGWLAHQLGEGNNLGLRLAVLRGQIPVPKTVGRQHRTFDDTLPEK